MPGKYASHGIWFYMKELRGRWIWFGVGSPCDRTLAGILSRYINQLLAGILSRYIDQFRGVSAGGGGYRFLLVMLENGHFVEVYRIPHTRGL